MIRRICLLIALLLAAPGLPAATAQSGNAADSYRAAFDLAGMGYGFGQPVPEARRLITDDDWNFITDLQSPMGDAARARLDALLLKAAPALEKLRDATQARKCDWELDRKSGFAMLMPHLAPMRGAARLLRAQAAAQIEDGDAGGAVETLGALGSIGMHVGQDTVLVSSLVGAAVGNLMTNTGQDAIEYGVIDQKAAQRLLETLSPLKRNDPYRFSEAVKGEFAAATASLRDAKTDAELRQLLGMKDSSVSGGMDANTMSVDSARADLAKMRPLYDAAAAAFADPNPDAALTQLRKLEQSVEAGRGGTLGKILMPSFLKIFEAKLRSDQQLALFLARLQVIADGKEQREDYANAAPLLARASSAARSIPESAQEAIELLRLAPAALDAEAARRAGEMLARAQQAVIAPLADAAALKHCDFKLLRRPLPSLEVPLLGGLRGAVRVALADGLRAARASASADAALPALVIGYRVAALLALDPSLARAAVAHSIWRDTTAALEEVQRLTPLSKSAADTLERAMATMAANDPFGFRKGGDADAMHTIDEMALHVSGATPEAREVRAAVLRLRGASAIFARVAFATVARRSDDTMASPQDAILVRVTDLYPTEASARIEEAFAEARTRYAEARKETSSIKDLAIYPPVPFDLPLPEQKSIFRKEDPVRGVTFVDAPTLIGRAGADYVRAFDALKLGGAQHEPAAAPAAPAAK